MNKHNTITFLTIDRMNKVLFVCGGEVSIQFTQS